MGSAPFFASLISLLNEHRLQNGKSPLGFLNPLLYEMAKKGTGFTDVTVGNNHKDRSGIPVREGYLAPRAGTLSQVGAHLCLGRCCSTSRTCPAASVKTRAVRKTPRRIWCLCESSEEQHHIYLWKRHLAAFVIGDANRHQRRRRWATVSD